MPARRRRGALLDIPFTAGVLGGETDTGEVEKEIDEVRKEVMEVKTSNVALKTMVK